MPLLLPCLLPTDEHLIKARLSTQRRLLYNSFRTGLSPMALQLLWSLVVRSRYSLSVFTTKRRQGTPRRLKNATVSKLRQRPRARTASLSCISVSKSVLVVNKALDQLAFIITTLQTQILSSISNTKAKGLDMLML
jgi:hypothetical protein